MFAQSKRITQLTPCLFQIPADPLVLKFLAYHYPINPFVLRGGNQHFNPYSVFLNGQLERYQYVDTVMPRRYERLTARLTVSISTSKAHNGQGRHLTPQKIWAFNEFCRQSFLRQMVGEVRIRVEGGAGVNASVHQFLARYGIDEEVLSFDTARRYYHRVVRRK